MSELNEKDLSQLTPEEQERVDELQQLLLNDEIDPTLAINILINAVQICYGKEIFDELDKYLIARALSCIKDHVDRGEDLVIKVNG